MKIEAVTPDTNKEFIRQRISALWTSCENDLIRLQKSASLPEAASPFSGRTREAYDLAWEQAQTFANRCAELYSEIKENYPGLVKKALRSIGIYSFVPAITFNLGEYPRVGFRSKSNLCFEIEFADDACEGEFFLIEKTGHKEKLGRPNPLLIAEKAPVLLEAIIKLIPREERTEIEKLK